MGLVYANEFDPDAAHWLSCLPIQLGKIDSRSIKEVSANDIRDFTQCHFFAGIGGWPLALELAGWPADAPVWTGSCPCQPFSQAGKQKGFDDERHLWPEFHRLIKECQPPTVFGEQVASKAGRAWLAVVRADLEALGYAVGAADLCAAGVGAPQIRQRLFWVAIANSNRCHQTRKGFSTAWNDGAVRDCASSDSGNGRLASSGCEVAGHGSRGRLETSQRCEPVDEHQHDRGLGSSEGDGYRSQPERRSDCEIQDAGRQFIAGGSSTTHWSDVEWVYCRDGKWRPVKSGVRVLAYGVSGRVAQLRGLGNAIVPQVAATFVEAVMEILGIERREWT